MRSIVVHADNGSGTSQRLRTGVALARHLHGRLAVLVNTPLQRFVAMDPFGGAYLASQAIDAALRAEAELVDALSARLADEDVRWSIETSQVEFADAMASAGRLADLAIVGYGDGPANNMAGAAALALDCAVLAIPEHMAAVDLSGRACIAWDGGVQAANALRAAVPLLTGASHVDLVTVTEKSGGIPATAAQHYLSLYNIQADHVACERGLSTTEEVLEKVAADRGAGWLIMGAYGHSRLRETMFGGVTRYLLDSARLPLLLRH